MAQFATAGELAARLGITLTTSEETRAGSLLTLASGLIQKEAKQRIERVASDTLARRGTELARIRLPERPVESVTSVSLDGVLIPATDYYLDGDELVREMVSAEFAGVPSGGWGHSGEPLVIVYTHGYAIIPDAIAAVSLEAVVRAWVNPGSVMSERYGSEQVAFLQGGTPHGLLLTTAEQRVIRETLRTLNGTVQLR